MKTIWECTSFGESVYEGNITMGESVCRELARGILHEICLVSDLNIMDLEA